MSSIDAWKSRTADPETADIPVGELVYLEYITGPATCVDAQRLIGTPGSDFGRSNGKHPDGCAFRCTGERDSTRLARALYLEGVRGLFQVLPTLKSGMMRVIVHCWSDQEAHDVVKTTHDWGLGVAHVLGKNKTHHNVTLWVKGAPPPCAVPERIKKEDDAYIASIPRRKVAVRSGAPPADDGPCRAVICPIRPVGLGMTLGFAPERLLVENRKVSGETPSPTTQASRKGTAPQVAPEAGPVEPAQEGNESIWARTADVARTIRIIREAKESSRKETGRARERAQGLRDRIRAYKARPTGRAGDAGGMERSASDQFISDLAACNDELEAAQAAYEAAEKTMFDACKSSVELADPSMYDDMLDECMAAQGRFERAQGRLRDMMSH